MNLQRIQRIQSCIAIAEICARVLELAVGPSVAMQTAYKEQQREFAAELADGGSAKFCHVLTASDRITVALHVHQDLDEPPTFEINVEGQIAHNILTERRLKIFKAFLRMALRTNSRRWRL